MEPRLFAVVRKLAEIFQVSIVEVAIVFRYLSIAS